MTDNRLLTPEGYDRDTRHFSFDTKNKNMSYSVGDCLGIFPYNDQEEVLEFLDKMKWKND